MSHLARGPGPRTGIDAQANSRQPPTRRCLHLDNLSEAAR